MLLEYSDKKPPHLSKRFLSLYGSESEQLALFPCVFQPCFNGEVQLSGSGDGLAMSQISVTLDSVSYKALLADWLGPALSEKQNAWCGLLGDDELTEGWRVRGAVVAGEIGAMHL